MFVWKFEKAGYNYSCCNISGSASQKSLRSLVFPLFLFPAGCGELVSVSEPVTHRKADSIEGKYGVWMQDPEAVSPYTPEMIWRIDTIGADVRKLFGYDDMEQLSKGFPSKVGVTWAHIKGPILC